MMSSLDGNGNGGSSSIGSPFGRGSGLDSPNPFGTSPSSPKNDSMFGGLGNLNLDEMMRDIDRKIAELDAEEAREKAKLEEAKKKAESPLTDTKPLQTSFNLYEEDNKDVVKIPKAEDLFNNLAEDIQKSNELNDIKKNQESISDIELPLIKEEKPVVKTNIEIPKIEEPTNIELRPTIEPIVENKPQSNSYNIYNEDVISEPIINKGIDYNEITNSVEDKPIVNVSVDNVEVDKNIVSDDEFFDDFFGDD